MLFLLRFVPILLCALALPLLAQRASVRQASPEYLPAPVDSNSPAFWVDGQLNILTSTGMVLLSRGSSLFFQNETDAVDLEGQQHIPVWVEAAWLDDDGTLLLWYHHEPGGICPSNGLTQPVIGAAVSYDGGRSMIDLGVVLTAADLPSCDAKNGYFAGGHGDFSVFRHSDGSFYFYFSNYGGDVSVQGIAVARMAYEDRFQPQGAVWKYFQGEWNEPGLGGQVTPIIRTKVAWQLENTDSFWGPSIHWNTHLGTYVMLLNHSCCEPGWKQEGIYVSFNGDLSNPEGWSAPQLVLKDFGFGPAFYPQIQGLEQDGTDKQAGRVARLYVHGVSHWEIEFTPR